MNTIKLLGRKIHIKKISFKELEAMQGKEILGLWNVDKQTIYLGDGLSKTMLRKVFIHELTHAILSITGVSNLIGHKQEEAICDALEAMDDVFNLKKEL